VHLARTTLTRPCVDDSLCSLRRRRVGRPPLPPADEVNPRSHIDERVIRGLDALDTRDRVKDDLSLLLWIVIGDLVKCDRAELDDLPLVRPVDGRIVRDVSGPRDLGHELEHDGNGVGDFVVEIVCGFGLDVLFPEMLDALLGDETVSDKSLFAVLVNQLEGVDGEVRLAIEADRERFRGLDEDHCLWVGGEEVGDLVVSHGGEEVEELLAGANREEGSRVRDDIGVDAAGRLGELESQGKPTGVPVRVRVGELGDARGGGEPRDHGGGRVVEVRGLGEGRGGGSGLEVAREEDALGVD
jgi:hypothetical protein